MHKILIVEDQKDLADGLEVNFTKEGFSVLKAETGEAAIGKALKEDPDLIILDIMLPGISGLDVCRELRKKSLDMPIIMLTAKADEIDRVVGLEVGADDYVTKPFGIRELIARVHAHLRRRHPRQAQKVTRYRFGKVELDFEKYEATMKGEPIDLSQKEYEILRCFIHHRGEVVTRDRLLNEAWGYESYPTTRTVDTHILKLRKKIEEDPGNPRFLLSVHGEGYKFVG
jgi:DNA-binding response OmpR family regulator